MFRLTTPEEFKNICATPGLDQQSARRQAIPDGAIQLGALPQTTWINECK
jgi:hypothetical protein